LPETLAAIRAADIITIGPGSLYTSIIPNLLVTSVAEAIAKARATKIFIGNLMTQPGETDGYGFREHLETVRRYAPQIFFDYAIINDRLISPAQVELYRADGAEQILLDEFESSSDLAGEIVRADLLDGGEMVRHNSAQLARLVISSAARRLTTDLVSPEFAGAN